MEMRILSVKKLHGSADSVILFVLFSCSMIYPKDKGNFSFVALFFGSLKYRPLMPKRFPSAGEITEAKTF